MNVLILNWKDIKNPSRGGAEVIAFEFAKRLAAEGNEVTFFSRSFKNCLSEEKIDGVKVIRKGNMLSVYLHAFLYYKSLDHKPDKVIDMINSICWQTPLYVPKDKRVMYVNQLAEEVFFYELPFPISFIAYVLEKIEYLTYKTTAVLCYSESTKKDLITFGIPRKHIFLFPMGLDHERYKQSGIKSKEPLFLFVARLVKMKRAQLCIDAMRLFVGRYPVAKLVIMGNGPEENSLVEKVKKYQLEKNVELVTRNNFFLKKAKFDSKITYMQKATALLLPSVKEGWGMVVTEAAACGTPAIVTNVTGLRDSVVNNETGLILSKDPSPQELCNAMEKMVVKKEVARLSRNALQRAQLFNWDKSYHTFRDLLLHQRHV